MILKLNFQLLILSCIIFMKSYAQDNKSPIITLGNSAPPLRLGEWIKGIPVKKFDQGHVYVLEFWATWCKPCIAVMPHLTALANEYKDKVTFLGIDVYEKKSPTVKRIKNFVDSMGKRMDYRVVVEDSNFMVVDWLIATGEKDNGIPRTFVVNAEGKLAWIGHPLELEKILPEIINNTWDINKALAKRNFKKHLEEIDKEVNYLLFNYRENSFKPGDFGDPDSAILIINDIIKKEPNLKYAPLIASHTFSALLKTNSHKAYEYGKELLMTHTYDNPTYDIIIGSIKWYSDKLNLPAEIYQLGIKAYQAKLDFFIPHENVNLSKYYHKMAEWYWIAGNKSKAIEAIQKAIELLKTTSNFSKNDLDAYNSLLKYYYKVMKEN